MTKMLNKEKLETLNTKRLSAYKNALLKFPEKPSWDNKDSLCKESLIWKETYQAVKDILSKREHIEK